MRELQSKYLKEDGALTGKALEWGHSHGSNFRCLAQAVFFMESYSPALKTAGSIVRLEQWLSEDTDFPMAFRGKVEDSFRMFSELVLARRCSRSSRIRSRFLRWSL